MLVRILNMSQLGTFGDENGILRVKRCSEESQQDCKSRAHSTLDLEACILSRYFLFGPRQFTNSDAGRADAYLASPSVVAASALSALSRAPANTRPQRITPAWILATVLVHLQLQKVTSAVLWSSSSHSLIGQSPLQLATLQRQTLRFSRGFQ